MLVRLESCVCRWLIQPLTASSVLVWFFVDAASELGQTHKNYTGDTSYAAKVINAVVVPDTGHTLYTKYVLHGGETAGQKTVVLCSVLHGAVKLSGSNLRCPMWTCQARTKCCYIFVTFSSALDECNTEFTSIQPLNCHCLKITVAFRSPDSHTKWRKNRQSRPITTRYVRNSH